MDGGAALETFIRNGMVYGLEDNLFIQQILKPNKYIFPNVMETTNELTKSKTYMAKLINV